MNLRRISTLILVGIASCSFSLTPERQLYSSWDYNDRLPECSFNSLIQPCFCYSLIDEGDNIYCYNMTGDQIQEVFSRDFGETNIRMITVENVTSWTLPAEVFGDKRTEKIQFICKDLEGLVIDKDGFRGMNSTKEIHFQDCLFTARSTYESLGHLNNLETLFFSGSYLANNISFPVLPSLSNLYLFSTRMYSRIYLPTPHLLNQLWVYGSDANTVELILDSLRGTDLTTVRLTYSSLYRFTISLQTLKKLTVLTLDGNPMHGVHQQSLLLHPGVNLTSLSLVGTQMKYLQQYLFPEQQMASAHLALDNNTQLSIIAKESLYDLMVAMHDHGGYISLSGVRNLQCDCQLAWLVCAYKDYGDVLTGDPGCLNGSSVATLNPADFSHCSEELCSSAGSLFPAHVTSALLLSTLVYFSKNLFTF